MDIGSVRPVVTGITAPVPKAPAQGDQSVKTELPARAAVAEAGKPEGNSVGSSTSKDQGSNTASQQQREPGLDQRIEIDDSTRTIIFQKVDSDTGNVVEQVPEESALRLHAAMQAQLQELQGNAASTRQIDRSV